LDPRYGKVRLMLGGVLCLVWSTGSLSGITAASSLSLEVPVNCLIGTVCHIQNLFDHDPGEGFRDYQCGELGYDGHDGTDIRLPNLAWMEQGVAVLAAAEGRVRAIRDGMQDVDVRELGKSAISGREAGNAVAIDHGDGWETQYSHMRQGSIQVKPGEMVHTGQPLGLIGMSGNSEFPHLHFEVRYQGKPVDPFTGLQQSERCGLGKSTLWSDLALQSLGYRSTGLLQAGFADEAPTLESVDKGEYGFGFLPGSAPALVLWVEVFGVKMGDKELLTLLGPEGDVLVEKRGTVPKNMASRLSFAGKRRGTDSWARGVYEGRYELIRVRDGEKSHVLEVHRKIRVQ
jgi:hypothetical protein